MVTKPITPETAGVYHTSLTEKVLPAISENWTRNYRDIVIRLQKDNAPVHIKLDDPAFCVTSRTTGLDIQLVYHPPQQPIL